MPDRLVLFYVICDDGRIRHSEPFTTAHDAQHWAEWGHCCAAKHRIMRIDTSSCTEPARD